MRLVFARRFRMARAPFIAPFALLLFQASCAVPARRAEPHVPDRPIVLYSPHTDDGTVWTYGYGMQCPGGRPRYQGYLTSEVRAHAESQLRFRVTGSAANQAENLPVRDVRLRLTHRLYPSVAELPEDSAYTVFTDATGAAVLNVQPGIYRADVSLIGFVRGAAILRMRPGGADSVRVLLTTEGVC